MAKELKSAATEFELNEAFWKQYKPDSVKETGLSSKLRDYEKALKEAQKLDNSTGSPVAKANKWGEVRAALHDLTDAMPKAIDSLGKDKDSHKNLKASLERAHKALKGKTHPAYKTAEDKMVLPTEQEDVGGDVWNKWIAKIPKDDIRKPWNTVLKEFQDLAQGMPEDRQLEAALSEMRKTCRADYLEKMTGPRSFDSDVGRLLKSFESYQELVAQYIRNNVNALNQRNKTGELNPWLNDLSKVIKTEALFWRTLKSAKKPT
jgi:hypothetical protein